MITDTIAMWTKKHHVIGPFETPSKKLTNKPFNGSSSKKQSKTHPKSFCP
jgi:hypothetical protein